MRSVSLCLVSVLGLAGTSTAGELDLGLGAQATTTAWPSDQGGGGSLDASWWFRDWIAASFLGKEHYARVDDRFMSYFSFNVATRHTFGPVRAGASLGLVHQHEEARAAVMDQPLQSLFGVGDGIRHRLGTRAGVALALPFHDHAHGDWYVALDIDATKFMEQDRGPSWMMSAGVSAGFTYDFSANAK